MSAPVRATNEEIISAYRTTGSIWKAAESLGLCGQSVYERLRRIGFPIFHATWSTEEAKAAKDLALRGVPISKIAMRLGRTYAGVACKLSEAGIRHSYTTKRKVRRGIGLTKAKVTALAKYILKTGMSVTKAAHRNRLTTTGLVNALEVHAPALWAEYVKGHSKLKTRQCPGCGLDFTPLTNKQKYCTAPCGSHARADVRYFGGNRRSATGLAEGVCQLCEKKGKVLAAHHVFGKENDPENLVLIALCQGCHQLVGILGKRADVIATEFWENLISLAIVRAWADKGRKALGTHVSVEVEELREGDMEELQGDMAVEIP